MTLLNLDIDYKRPKEQEDKLTNVELSVDYIGYAVSRKFPNLQGQKLRIWGRIQRKLDQAIDEDQKTVELEAAEVDFLKEAFTNVEFQAHLAKYAILLIDVIETLRA